ncbi:hypothetical protein K438DRAFT_173759 [Mycena galopus ATCC 62051]|nr:hypothetical protein K438DRAFT_173759 [Mycena galopus ATCC 62051]
MIHAMLCSPLVLFLSHHLSQLFRDVYVQLATLGLPPPLICLRAPYSGLHLLWAQLAYSHYTFRLFHAPHSCISRFTAYLGIWSASTSLRTLPTVSILDHTAWTACMLSAAL